MNLVKSIGAGLIVLSVGNSYAVAINGNVDISLLTNTRVGGAEELVLRLDNLKPDTPVYLTGLAIKDNADESKVYVQNAYQLAIQNPTDVVLAKNELMVLQYKAWHLEPYIYSMTGLAPELKFLLTEDAQWCMKNVYSNCRVMPLLLETDFYYPGEEVRQHQLTAIYMSVHD